MLWRGRLKVPLWQGQLARAAHTLKAAAVTWEKASELPKQKRPSPLPTPPRAPRTPAPFYGCPAAAHGRPQENTLQGAGGLMNNSTAVHE